MARTGHEAPRPGLSRALGGWTMLLLVAFVAGPGAQAEEPAPDFQARVDRAIDAGVVWLRSQQTEDGSFPLAPSSSLGMGDPSSNWAGGPWNKGLCALSVYTLAVCDVPEDDPALERGFENLRRLWKRREPGTRDSPVGPQDGVSTYFVSLCLLALDATYNRQAAALCAGPPDPRKAGSRRLGRTNTSWARELVAWLEEAQDPGDRKAMSRVLAPADGGGFGYGSPADPARYHDHSNTQFAVLGLKAASRLGIKVDDDVFLRALRHFLLVQEEDGPEVARVPAANADDEKARRAPGESRTTDEAPGTDRARGWGYMCPSSHFAEPEMRAPPPGALPPGLPPGGFPGMPPPGGGPGPALPGGVQHLVDSPTPSMTAGGVSTLVICRSELEKARGLTPELRTRTVTGIRDGLAWLGRSLHEAEAAARSPLPGLPPDLPPGFPPGLGPSKGGLPVGPLEDFYFLYGLERACILGGVDRIGDLDWYRIGAERILDRQREDGSFLSHDLSNGNGRPETDSCFALLFLKRAVFRVPQTTAVTPSTDR